MDLMYIARGAAPSPYRIMSRTSSSAWPPSPRRSCSPSASTASAPGPSPGALPARLRAARARARRDLLQLQPRATSAAASAAASSTTCSSSRSRCGWRCSPKASPRSRARACSCPAARLLISAGQQLRPDALAGLVGAVRRRRARVDGDRASPSRTPGAAWRSGRRAPPRRSTRTPGTCSRQLHPFPARRPAGLALAGLLTVVPAGLVAWYPARALLGIDAAAHGPTRRRCPPRGLLFARARDLDLHAWTPPLRPHRIDPLPRLRTPSLSCRGVRKIYRQRVRSARLRDVLRNLLHPEVRVVEALRGVDLTVRRGEIVAYAGPNGAGKSTTIKLLSGLLAPDSGSVRALGMDPVARPRALRRPHRRRLRPAHRAVVGPSGRGDLRMEARRLGHPAAALRAHAAAWCASCSAWTTSSTPWPASSASASACARTSRLALLHEPEILLLDEPTLGLDVLARRRILSLHQGAEPRARRDAWWSPATTWPSWSSSPGAS